MNEGKADIKDLKPLLGLVADGNPLSRAQSEAAFLASDLASFINGAVVGVDGGLLL